LYLTVVFHDIHNKQAANGSMVADFNEGCVMKILLSLALFLPMAAAAQESGPESPGPATTCSSPEYRQFDFWIGDWNVTSAEEPAGTNSIHPIHNGCALQENWQGSGEGGISGSSFNIYDQSSDRWHQTWVDASGTLLQLDGSLSDGVMVLGGQRPSRDGSGMVQHRISWTPNPDGSVRQLWEASRDEGDSWTVLFDGLYTKVPASL
jgi:hypothetical protein